MRIVLVLGMTDFALGYKKVFFPKLLAEFPEEVDVWKSFWNCPLRTSSQIVSLLSNKMHVNTYIFAVLVPQQVSVLQHHLQGVEAFEFLR